MIDPTRTWSASLATFNGDVMVGYESYKDYWRAVPMPVDSWQNKITNQPFRPKTSFLLREVANGTPVGMLVTMH